MKTIVCDIDGVIALYDPSNVEGATFCMNTFKEQIKQLNPNDIIFNILSGFKAAGYKIILLTARPEHLIDDTEAWLEEHSSSRQTVVYDAIIMYPEPMYLENVERYKDRELMHSEICLWKKAMVKALLDQGHDIQLFMDDSLANVNAVKSLGIQTFHVSV